MPLGRTSNGSKVKRNTTVTMGLDGVTLSTNRKVYDRIS